MIIVKNKIVILLIVLGVIALFIGGILIVKNNNLLKNRIEILDATYSCDGNYQRFYEDREYIYFFPCTMSNSVFVLFPNGNKQLVVNALEEEKVTIDELIKAGLNVDKRKK